MKYFIVLEETHVSFNISKQYQYPPSFDLNISGAITNYDNIHKCTKQIPFLASPLPPKCADENDD